MNKILRTSLAIAFALACVDGHAKSTKHCIVSLEAHDAPAVEIHATSPKSACPVALARDDAREGTSGTTPAKGGDDESAAPRA